MKHLFCLDFGTSKTSLLKFNIKTKETEIISVRSHGIHKGVIADLGDAKKNLNALIESCEQKWQVDIEQISVLIPSVVCKMEIYLQEIDLKKKTISEKFLEQTKKNAAVADFDPTKQIISLQPISYKIDERQWTKTPLGFSGNHLTIKYHVILAEKSYLKDLSQMFVQTGLKKPKFQAHALALSEYFLHRKAQGGTSYAIFDIGAGKTELLVVQDKNLMHLASVGVGGNLLKNDLKVGLALTDDIAETLKNQNGFHLSTLLEDKTTAGESLNLLNKPSYSSILTARISEIFYLLREQIKPHLLYLDQGIFVTGGSSQLKGLSHIIQNFFTLPIEIDPREDPSNAAVLGLLYLELKQLEQQLYIAKDSYLTKAKEWIFAMS